MWPIVGLTLAAFALRLALARGDLWGDEAASTMMSLAPTAEMLRTLATAEPHPPLFPLVLKAWMRVAGTGELAVRFPSIAAGTALVPVMAALGRAGGPVVSLVAALLAAFSPFLLWYQTEARMYPFAILFGAASFLWLIRLVEQPSTRRVALYGVTAALALLSHYFVLYVGLAQALFGAVALAGDRRLLRPLAIGAAVALLPIVGWMVAAGRVVGSYYGAQPGRIDLVGVLASSLARIPAGWSVEANTAALVAVPAGLVAVAGARLAWRARPTRAWIAWLIVPAAVGMAVSVVRPMYQERYLAVLAPAYLLLVALAIGRAPRLPRGLLLLGTTIACAVPIWNIADGRYVRSQYGSHTAEINAIGRPGEAVILTGTSQTPLYEYYASRGGAGLPIFGLPREPPATAAQVGPELRSIVDRFDALWVLLYAVHDYDPGDLVERWLTANAYRAPPRWTINGRLIRFQSERATAFAPPTAPMPIGPGWRLGASLPEGPVGAGALAPARLEIERDDAAAGPPPKLRLRLLDDAGFIWGEADEVLGSGFGLPSAPRWIERRAIPVLGGAPDGNYRVEAQLYEEQPTGTRPIGSLGLGKIRVVSSSRFWPGQIAGFVPSDAAAGPWRLLGWAGASSRPAGERDYLTTVWQAGANAPAARQLVRFVAPDGAAVSTRAAAIQPAPRGMVRRVQLAPPIGAHWAPGEYRVDLGLRDPAGAKILWPGDAAWLRLGTLRVTPGRPLPAPRPPERTVDAVFGGIIRLRGFSVAASPFAVTLQWEALGEVDENLSVFVHALDDAGKIAAQSDGPPAGGGSPTDGWSPGDVTDDRREVGAASGSYRLLVGLYDPLSGGRLSATTQAGQPLGDALDLGQVRVGG